MSKKGFVYSWRDPTAAAKTNALNADWYYNWGPSPTPGVDKPFIPMIWGTKNLAQLPHVKGEMILGFNEPDRVDQSNIDFSSAIKYWSQFTTTGKRLGSPATASNPAKSGWHQDFMGSRGVDVDFICVHWYAQPNPHSLLGMLHDLYVQYKKPIWITEFAVADWSGEKMASEDEVVDFMEKILPALDDLEYVERYSWKTRTTSDVNMGTSALFNDDGSLTRLGQVYATHGMINDDGDVPVNRAAALVEAALNSTVGVGEESIQPSVGVRTQINRRRG
jgi:hypothetical protein